MAEKASKWRRIPRGEVCQVCGSKDWCTVSADGEVIRCMRVESPRQSPARDGTMAWLHDVDPNRRQQLREKVQKQPVAKIEDVPGLAMAMARQSLAVDVRARLSKQFGVSVHALEEMFVGVGWGPDERLQEFASFPARDGDGKIVGITRRFANGKKLTYPGTSNGGLFCCTRWWWKMGPIFVVEGASDTLAMHTANLAAIGRPSNVAGAPVIVSMLDRLGLRSRTVVVVCEDDRKSEDEVRSKSPIPHDEECSGCSRCWPGEFGARAVQEQLVKAGFSVEYARPIEGYKDARSMWQGGVLGDWLDLIGMRNEVGYDSEAWYRWASVSGDTVEHSAQRTAV